MKWQLRDKLVVVRRCGDPQCTDVLCLSIARAEGRPQVQLTTLGNAAAAAHRAAESEQQQ